MNEKMLPRFGPFLLVQLALLFQLLNFQTKWYTTRNFVKIGKGAMSIDPEAVQRDARLNGKFVLRTNSTIAADEVAIAYKINGAYTILH